MVRSARRGVFRCGGTVIKRLKFAYRDIQIESFPSPRDNQSWPQRPVMVQSIVRELTIP
jgi:hypothetical protein